MALLALSLWRFISHDFWHWKSGLSYQYWSGIGSVFTPKDLVYLLVIWRVWRGLKHHFECHAADCHRWGLHRVGATGFRTCWKHHPVLGKHPVRHVPVLHIHAAHRERAR